MRQLAIATPKDWGSSRTDNNSAENASVVSMPVDTLALVPQNSNITRVGRLAYTSMIFLAQSSQSDAAGLFHAPLNKILRGFGSDNRHSTELKRHLRSMIGTVVEWQSATLGEAEWGACALLSQADISKKNGENWVAWAYPPKIREQVLDPPRWAQVNMVSAGQLRTHAAVVLYGICARYKDSPRGMTAKQPWAWWVPVLTGSPAGKELKTEYRFFKRDYLRSAIEDINEVTEIEIEIKEHKNGRSIESLQFLVKKKSSVALESRKESIDVSQYLRATELGILGKQAEELSMKFGEEDLALALDKLEKRMGERGKPEVGDKAAYLTSILKNLSVVSVVKSTAKGSAAAHEHVPSNLNDLVLRLQANATFSQEVVNIEEVAARKAEETNRRLKAVREKLELMPEFERNSLLDQLHATFTETIVTKRLMARIRNYEWRSPQVLGELVTFYELRLQNAANTAEA